MRNNRSVITAGYDLGDGVLELKNVSGSNYEQAIEDLCCIPAAPEQVEFIAEHTVALVAFQ